MSKFKPDIAPYVDQIEDDNLKEIFRRLIKYFESQNQLQDFVHLEIQTDSAQTNLKVRHNLGFIPKDLVRSKKVGSGNITFNHANFDEQFLDVTTTGEVRWRGFVGTYIDDSSTVADTETETL